MKNLLLFIVALYAFSANAHAANPHEELKQLTAQLQSNFGDAALREKIIKLARTIKPAPAVPAEAERFDGRGEYAFKNAKNEADYLAAAKEFEKASNAAPWVASFYFNAATAYEKAQRPTEAKRNFELYLLAAPTAKDERDVRRRISGLEFAIEKANSPEVLAMQARKREESERRATEELLRSLEGAIFVAEGSAGWNRFWRISAGRISDVHRQIGRNTILCERGRDVAPMGTEMICDTSDKFVGRIAKMRFVNTGNTAIFELAPDNLSISVTETVYFTEGSIHGTVRYKLIRQ